MNVSVFNYAICAFAVSALLVACGGSQPPVGAPGAPHVSTWMLPEAKSEGLIYAYDTNAGNVYVFSYPEGKLVGTLSGIDSPQGECVDPSGNIWIANYSNDSLIEYAHGGTQPIATLQEGQSAEAQACSIDPISGDLAVTNRYPTSAAVFAKASGSPTMYSLDGFSYWATCTYDDSGNLFANDWANSHAIAELPHASHALLKVPLAQRLRSYSMQWDGQYLAMRIIPRHYGGPTRVARLAVVRGAGRLAGSAFLHDRDNRQAAFTAQFFVQGGLVFGPDRFRGAKGGDHGYSLDVWNYPSGGRPIKVISKIGQLNGAVMSSAQVKRRTATTR